MQAVIVEDEPHAQKALSQMINLVAPDIEIAGIASEVEEAYGMIQQVDPNLILLDVKLGNQTGFDLLAKFNQPRFNVLFITAYNEYAIEAFKWNAVHYITKPIESQALKLGLQKARAQQALLNAFQLEGLIQQVNQQQVPRHIILRHDLVIERQLIEDIVRLEGSGSMTFFYCVETDFETQKRSIKRKAVSSNIGYFEQLLPPTFFRCHQSHMVNQRFVKLYDRSDNYLLLETNTQVPVSRRGKDGLEAWLST